MGFSSARARAQEAVYDRLGEDAEWNGVAVRVRLRTADVIVGLEAVNTIMPSIIIKVPASEVANPVIGDQVLVRLAAGDQSYSVISEPMRNLRGEWECGCRSV